MPLLRDVMTAILVRFEWHGDYPGSGASPPSYTVHFSPPTTDPCNKAPHRHETDGEPGPGRDRRVDRRAGRPAGSKRILGELPRLQRGEGYLWAPGHGILDRVAFPAIRTFDSSRTPKRGEHLATPHTLAEVDLTAIMAALAAVETEDLGKPKEGRHRHVQLERELAAAKARIRTLEQENRELNSRLAGIAVLAAGAVSAPVDAALVVEERRPKIEPKPVRPLRVVTSNARSS
jgi:hypothetical protein